MKRPPSVTTLLWLVLSLTAWNTLRLGASIADWDLLAEFAPRPGPIYVTASASFWTLTGLGLLTAIRRRKPRARAAAATYLVGYPLWAWSDRLLFQQANPNWPFALVMTVIFLGAVAIILFNRKTKSFFNQRESHEQTSTDSESA